MTLHALRKEVGKATFFDILRGWAKRYRHGKAKTPHFVKLAEKRSGKQLDALFDEWLYRKGKPQRPWDAQPAGCQHGHAWKPDPRADKSEWRGART